MALEGGGTQKAVSVKKKKSTKISGAAHLKFLQGFPGKLANLAQIGANAQKKVAAAKAADPFSGLAEMLRGAFAASAGSDSAASGLNAQLQREGLAEEKRQFNEDIAFRKSQQAFQEKDTNTQRLLEAAGLATSPTGAIQLAYMARGQGAPVAQIRSIFQNLPFVQALLQGKTLPGFGLPEQLGGGADTKGLKFGGKGGSDPGIYGQANTVQGRSMARTLAGAGAAPGGNYTVGSTRGVGLVLPSELGVTEQQFGGLSGQEQEFLGALHTAETGEGSEQFFQKMLKGFIPTTGSSAALAF